MKMSHYFTVFDTLWNSGLFWFLKTPPLILNYSQLKLGTFLIFSTNSQVLLLFWLESFPYNNKTQFVQNDVILFLNPKCHLLPEPIVGGAGGGALINTSHINKSYWITGKIIWSFHSIFAKNICLGALQKTVKGSMFELICFFWAFFDVSLSMNFGLFWDELGTNW